MSPVPRVPCKFLAVSDAQLTGTRDFSTAWLKSVALYVRQLSTWCPSHLVVPSGCRVRTTPISSPECHWTPAEVSCGLHQRMSVRLEGLFLETTTDFSAICTLFQFRLEQVRLPQEGSPRKPQWSHWRRCSCTWDFPSMLCLAGSNYR